MNWPAIGVIGGFVAQAVLFIIWMSRLPSRDEYQKLRAELNDRAGNANVSPAGRQLLQLITSHRELLDNLGDRVDNHHSDLAKMRDELATVDKRIQDGGHTIANRLTTAVSETEDRLMKQIDKLSEQMTVLLKGRR